MKNRLIAATLPVLFSLSIGIAHSESTSWEYTDKDFSSGQTEKRVTLTGPGDYKHEYSSGGESNIRLREGETHIIKVRRGDRVTKQSSSLSN